MITPAQTDRLSALEAEALHIIREAVAQANRPILLFSAGKDSAVLAHLASIAFAPAAVPLALLHIDTTWKFAAMYAFRDQAAERAGFELIVHKNPEAEAENINPFEHGAAYHTERWKTEGLKQALDAGGFDLALGGARRDEEKSRAKERIFSVRGPEHTWEPRAQRPELWDLYNGRLAPGQTMRVFPLSNWTELDVWRYIQRQDISLPELYFAAERPVVVREGALIVRDDERLPLKPGEQAELRKVRFRTLGCYPLTAAIESEADNLEALIAELESAANSERAGRLIDHDSTGSMERKKREGYF